MRNSMNAASCNVFRVKWEHLDTHLNFCTTMVVAISRRLIIFPQTLLVTAVVLVRASLQLSITSTTESSSQQQILANDSIIPDETTLVEEGPQAGRGFHRFTKTGEDEDKEDEAPVEFTKPENYDRLLVSLAADSTTLTNFTEEFGGGGDTKGRGATKNTKTRWNYEMKVAIDPEFSKDVREQIEAGIFTLQSAMKCFKFLKAKNPDKVKGDHVYFKASGNQSGCYSSLGRRGGRQEIVIQPNGSCKPFGTTVHETMHTLGFYHEHTRPDRDQYVNVNLTNTKQDSQYAIIPDQIVLVNEFDFESIMLYPPNPAMQPKPGKVPSGVKVGQRDHLSKLDIERLNALYPCDKKPNKSRRRRR